MLPWIATSILSFSILATTAPAQGLGGRVELIREHHHLDYSNFGSQVAGAGDLDGDGIPDYVVTALGSVFAFSGKTGALLYEKRGLPSNFGSKFGEGLVVLDDLDQDGAREFLVSASGNVEGLVFLFHGRTGALVRRFFGEARGDAFGAGMAVLNDLDGDGVSEILIGAPNHSGYRGRVTALSGASGKVLYHVDGEVIGGFATRLGAALAAVGDVDLDGFEDWLGYAKGFSNSKGAAELRSGVDGALIHRFSEQKGIDFGQGLAGLGDVNGDSVPDLAIGDPSPNRLFWPGGSVIAYSGANMQPLWIVHGQFVSYHGDDLGWQLKPAGDVNGDAIADLLVSAPGVGGGNYPQSVLLCGKSGRRIASYSRYVGPGSLMMANETSVGVLGDLDGDGVPEILHGDPLNRNFGPRAFVWSFKPLLYSDQLEVSNGTGGNVNLTLRFPVGDAGLPYLVLASAQGQGPMVMSGVNIPLTADFLFNRTLNGRHPGVFQGASGILDPQGEAVCRLTIPPNRIAGHVGRTFYLAAISRTQDGQGVTRSSVSVPLTVVP